MAGPPCRLLVLLLGQAMASVASHLDLMDLALQLTPAARLELLSEDWGCPNVPYITYHICSLVLNSTNRTPSFSDLSFVTT
jgi:hypothetical protein